MTLEIERNCCAVIQAFAYHVDRRDNEAVLALFTGDGQFNRPGEQVQGLEAIRTMLEARPAEIVTRHQCQPPHFVMISASEAQAVTAFTMYRAQGSPGGPAKLERPAIVGDYHDLFVATDGKWKIARRDVVPVLLGSES